MIGTDVYEVYTAETSLRDEPDTVVVLKAQGQDRYLPIWITAVQGHNIVSRLRGQKLERPQTYELMAQLIEQLGGKVESVHITINRDKIYYATLRVLTNGVVKEVDCRPSDALALAVQVGAPVSATPELFDVGGVTKPTAFLPVIESIKPFELN